MHPQHVRACALRLAVIATVPITVLASSPAEAKQPIGVPGDLSLTVEVAPAREGPATRTLVFDQAARQHKTWFDVQDGYEHNLRGLSLRELIARVKAPKTIDAVVFTYSDGMEVPLRLNQRDEVDAIFVALEHGNVRDQFSTTYTLHDGSELPCPKIVYGRKVKEYSTWIYPGALSSIRLVSWKAYEARLAQPTRQLPDRSGWPIYLRHCQNCHGIGGLGAKRGPDFLTDMEAYRRIPPFAVTDVGQPPSLHEKVKGFADGKMPVLTQVSNQDIATLWRWLHAIHKGGTK